MNIALSVAFIALFCMDYYFMYSDTIKRNPEITEKQKAYILSIKASTTLFLISIYFNYKFIASGFDVDLYTSRLNSNDNFMLELSVFNLISYLIMDCYVGYNKYHKYMCTLSGYTHHIVYTFVSIIALYKNVPGFYFLFMIEELPTIFLSSGNYNKGLRQDNIFGLTFFLTRLLYHGYLTWKFSFNKMFLIFGALSFGLHSYWFKNWFTKYFLKTNRKNVKQE
jgi:hypothetical protein